MSGGTVRRYNVSAWEDEPDVLVVRASDYDALRAKIEALEQELESHAREISPAMAQAKIDALNAKVEAYKKALQQTKDNFADYERTSLLQQLGLESQLAAMQARVKELEKPRFVMADSAVVEYLENEVEQLWPMLGVESAFVTDLSHVGDFPDEQLGAEKYIWQAAIDLLRNHLAQLQAQLAAMTAERDRLEAALEFYADPDTYFGCGFLFDRPTGGFDSDFDDGHEDYDRPMPGKAARAALRGEPGGG